MEPEENAILPYAQTKLKQLESQSPKAELRDYYMLEEELLSKAKTSKQPDITYQLYLLLHSSFFKDPDDIRLDIEKSVKRLFYFYFFSFSSTENRDRLFQTNSNTKELRIYKQKRAEVFSTIWDECTKHILTNYNKIDVLPHFLLYQEKKLVSSKVDINLQRHFNYPIDSVLSFEDPIYTFFFKAFEDLYDAKTNLFDSKVFDEGEKMLCFGALALCNYRYINQKDQNKKIFLNNMKKYISILGLQGKSKELVKKIIQLTTDKSYDYDSEKKKVIEKIGDIKEKNGDKFLLMVFSFSCLLNSFLVTETEEKKDILFTSALKCSAKERQFLINILKEVNAIDINYVLETFVFQKLIKTYTKELFDENNKAKVLLKYQFIVDNVSKVGAKDSNANDTVLNEIEAKVFASLFEKFKTEKEGIFSVDEDNFLSTLQLSQNSQETFLFNLPALYIHSQHPFRTSTHVCICIDGNFTKKVSYYRNIPISSLLYNSNTTCADFYQFAWQNEKNFFKFSTETVIEDLVEKESAVNKAVAKFYGKLLAYIIASRAIFKFQSISLMGFSLGCHVIKHCLLELNKIAGKLDTDDVIKDIVFVGGCTVIDKDKYPNVFSNVAGSIANVYNENDSLLQAFSQNAIGLKPMRMMNETDSIVNIDLSKNALMIQEEYKGSFAKIIAEMVTLL